MTKSGIARVGLVAASLMAAASMTAAQAQEGELMKQVLGSIGIIPEDKAPIDYRERAPLVLPPRMDLREPAAPGSVQARNPQWPNDPDVQARKRQIADERTPTTQTDRYRMNSGNTRLSVQEMRSARDAGAGLPTAPHANSDRAWIHPDILRAQGRKDSTVAVSGETGRRSLTDPPSAYRASATGQPIRGSFEAPSREDESDPKVFLRQQAQRRNQ